MVAAGVLAEVSLKAALGAKCVGRHMGSREAGAYGRARRFLMWGNYSEHSFRTGWLLQEKPGSRGASSWR